MRNRGGVKVARKKAKAIETVSEPEPASAPAPLRLEWRSPAELAEHPRNWRRHPETQTAALSDVIAEVGWAGACLYNERTGRLIDGHARRKVALEQGCEKVPVLVGDWSEEDEAKILATLDPLSAMAQADGPALAALLADVQTGSGALGTMLATLWQQVAASPSGSEPKPPDEFPSYGADLSTEHQCPRCGYRWSGNSHGAADETHGHGADGD